MMFPMNKDGAVKHITKLEMLMAGLKIANLHQTKQQQRMQMEPLYQLYLMLLILLAQIQMQIYPVL